MHTVCLQHHGSAYKVQFEKYPAVEKHFVLM